MVSIVDVIVVNNDKAHGAMGRGHGGGHAGFGFVSALASFGKECHCMFFDGVGTGQKIQEPR